MCNYCYGLGCLHCEEDVDEEQLLDDLLNEADNKQQAELEERDYEEG
jgi:hypothetical protein